MSAASDQKLFCKLCSPFCCSFNEFVEEKVITRPIPPPSWLLPPFLPFHMGVLKARILKWFAIPSSSGPCFVRTLSTMTCPSWVAMHGMVHSLTELHKAVIHVIILVSFLWMWFLLWRPWDCSSFFFCLSSDGWWKEASTNFLMGEAGCGKNWVLLWWTRSVKL